LPIDFKPEAVFAVFGIPPGFIPGSFCSQRRKSANPCAKQSDSAGPPGSICTGPLFFQFRLIEKMYLWRKSCYI